MDSPAPLATQVSLDRRGNQDQRVVVSTNHKARKQGLVCATCGIRTHIGSTTRKSPLTNQDVYNGHCIRCTSSSNSDPNNNIIIPSSVVDQWHRLQQQNGTRQNNNNTQGHETISSPVPRAITTTATTRMSQVTSETHENDDTSASHSSSSVQAVATTTSQTTQSSPLSSSASTPPPPPAAATAASKPRLSPEERMQVAQRKGMCVRCLTRTHTISATPQGSTQQTPLPTCSMTHPGYCNNCANLPPTIREDWRRRLSPTKQQQQQQQHQLPLPQATPSHSHQLGNPPASKRQSLPSVSNGLSTSTNGFVATSPATSMPKRQSLPNTTSNVTSSPTVEPTTQPTMSGSSHDSSPFSATIAQTQPVATSNGPALPPPPAATNQKSSQRLSPKERMEVAHRKGMCVRCLTRTHSISQQGTRTPLETNSKDCPGYCDKCAGLPVNVRDNWRQTQTRTQSQSQQGSDTKEQQDNSASPQKAQTQELPQTTRQWPTVCNLDAAANDPAPAPAAVAAKTTTRITPEERERLATRKGMCVRCGTRTHRISPQGTKTPLSDTNSNECPGYCHKCGNLPANVREDWRRQAPTGSETTQEQGDVPSQRSREESTIGETKEDMLLETKQSPSERGLPSSPAKPAGGTRVSPEERAHIAKRKGMCVRCGTRTHSITQEGNRTALNTNSNICPGYCIKCANLPVAMREDWRRPSPASVSVAQTVRPASLRTNDDIRSANSEEIPDIPSMLERLQEALHGCDVERVKEALHSIQDVEYDRQQAKSMAFKQLLKTILKEIRDAGDAERCELFLVCLVSLAAANSLQVKETIVEEGAIDGIIEALFRHPGSAGILEWSTETLYYLFLELCSGVVTTNTGVQSKINVVFQEEDLSVAVVESMKDVGEHFTAQRWAMNLLRFLQDHDHGILRKMEANGFVLVAATLLQGRSLTYEKKLFQYTVDLACRVLNTAECSELSFRDASKALVAVTNYLIDPKAPLWRKTACSRYVAALLNVPEYSIGVAGGKNAVKVVLGAFESSLDKQATIQCAIILFKAMSQQSQKKDIAELRDSAASLIARAIKATSFDVEAFADKEVLDEVMNVVSGDTPSGYISQSSDTTPCQRNTQNIEAPVVVEQISTKRRSKAPQIATHVLPPEAATMDLIRSPADNNEVKHVKGNEASGEPVEIDQPWVGGKSILPRATCDVPSRPPNVGRQLESHTKSRNALPGVGRKLGKAAMSGPSNASTMSKITAPRHRPSLSPDATPTRHADVRRHSQPRMAAMSEVAMAASAIRPKPVVNRDDIGRPSRPLEVPAPREVAPVMALPGMFPYQAEALEDDEC